jgi:hypothetical protein
MTTAYTSLLGFALPVTGELSGTWGDTVNDGITKLLDSAVAGTTTITSDADVTLTTTTGSANTSRQAIILWTAGGTATRTITAPAQSKIYTVINASSSTQSIILAGVGPTTGVTIAKGESALVAWNGSDFIKISNTAGPGTFTNLTVTGNTTLGDAVADTITVNSQFVTGTVLRSAQANTNTLALAAYDVDGAAYTNLITLTAANAPTLALTSTGVGTINNMSIGATTASTGAFTTLTSNGATTFTAGTASTTTGTGTLVITGGLGVSGRINAANFDGIVGANTAAAGAFTTLSATAGTSVATSSGFLTVGTVSATGMNASDIGIPNNKYLRGTVAAGTSSVALIGLDPGNIVQINANGSSGGTTVTGTLSATSSITSAPTSGDGSVVVRGFAGSSSFFQLTEAAVADRWSIGVAGSSDTLQFRSASFNMSTGTQRMTLTAAGLLTVTGGATIQGLTVGLGAGAVATNTAVGLQSLNANTTGNLNTSVGYAAMQINTAGTANSVFGYLALQQNTIGNSNTAIGNEALRFNTTASNNTAVGYQSLYSNTTASNNTAVGQQAGYSNTTGTANTALGDRALFSSVTGISNTAVGTVALYANTGSYNTALGDNALRFNTTASNNTAVGYQAGYSNTTGINNTAIGHQSLNTNSTGSNNTAIGLGALLSNTGEANTAVGVNVLYANTTGTQNVGVGGQASGVITTLRYNTTGSYNTAMGISALGNNTTASYNTAVGYQAAYANITGDSLTVVGANALRSNTTGFYNTAIGVAALYTNTIGNYNTAVGRESLNSSTTGSNNTAVGYQAGYTNQTGIYNAYFGYLAGKFATGSGNTFVGGATSSGGNPAGYLSTGNNNNFFGAGAGGSMGFGSKNTILGNFNGNQNSLDIRDLDNNIVLSDGDGNPRSYCDGNGTWTTANAPSSGVRTSQINNNGNTSGNQCLGLSLGTNTNNTSSYLIVANAAGADRMYVYGNGNIVNSNNSYGTLSDAKLKENIVDATPKLADLMQVKVRNYNLIGDQQKQIGVVAQELEQVFPGMIDESLDKDAEGNDIETTTKGVKMSVFVPILIKAIQELKAEVDSLKSQLNQGA